MVSIYVIICGVNNFAYVGCTAGKPSKRLREHRCLLNQGKHSSPKFQADWQKFGRNAFYLAVNEELPTDCSAAQKREAELRWMAFYKAESRLYNASELSFQLSPEAAAKGAANAHKEPGNRWTAEANLKRRLAQLGRPKGHGAKISATKRARMMR